MDFDFKFFYFHAVSSFLSACASADGLARRLCSCHLVLAFLQDDIREQSIAGTSAARFHVGITSKCMAPPFKHCTYGCGVFGFVYCTDRSDIMVGRSRAAWSGVSFRTRLHTAEICAASSLVSGAAQSGGRALGRARPELATPFLTGDSQSYHGEARI